MNVIIVSVRWPFRLLYLHHIVVNSRSSHGHNERVTRGLQLVYRASVTFKLNLCKFVVSKIRYFDQAIRPAQLGLAKCTTDSAQKIEHPTA